MLTLIGIGLTSSGLFGCLSLLFQYIKVNNDPMLYIVESVFARNILICGLCLIAGLSILVYVFVKSKNKNTLNKLVNNERNTLGLAKCYNCGLNLSENARVCPKCGAEIIRKEVK